MEEKKNVKAIDKFTMIVLAIVSAVGVSYSAMWSLTLMPVSVQIPIMLIMIIYIFALIPLLCSCLFLFIMFVIRYIKLKERKGKRILKTIVIVSITFFVIFSSHYVLQKYCWSGLYELKLDKKVEEIEDDEIKSTIVSLLEDDENYVEYEIQKIVIKPGFPDDYYVDIYYRDSNGKKQIKDTFLSDTKGYDFVEKAENLGEKYLPLNIALFVLSTILLTCQYFYLEKEYRQIALLKEEKQEGQSNRKIRVIMALIGSGLIILIVVSLGYYLKSKDSKQKTIDYLAENQLKEESINEDLLYETKINDSVSIRVMHYDSFMGQRSIVGVEKSTDGGNTWDKVKQEDRDFITIHNGAKFVFLDENIGFINDPGLAGTEGENRGLRVTVNGGKSFSEATIVHPSNITEKNLFVKDVPYIENGILKVQIYTINYQKDPVKAYYEFVSEDKGKTWKYSKTL